MVREVMTFLQGHGISTLFSVRIYKKYGDRAIEMVLEDPYRLANDFYGIGFFSADKVALSIGLASDSEPRLIAAVRHVLAAAREQGHCYLTAGQIASEVRQLLEMDCEDRLAAVLVRMEAENHLRVRTLAAGDGQPGAARGDGCILVAATGTRRTGQPDRIRARQIGSALRRWPPFPRRACCAGAAKRPAQPYCD